MRLTPGEIRHIRAAALDAFGPEAVVRLFGSRLDDARRGGDIDLLVRLPSPPPSQAKAAFRRRLDRTVGEREYDILFSTGEQPASRIERKALAEGVVI